MARRFPLLLLVSLFALLGVSHGQVSVNLELARRTYLNGEPIPVKVSITNLSGNELVFQGSKQNPWIDFIVKSSRGVPLNPVGAPAFGAVKIPAGKTFARTIDLTQIFGFSELGNFSIYSIVRLPNQRTGGFQSRRLLFNISTARPTWSQVVGVPGKPGVSHEFRLVRFSADRKDYLYAQIADPKTGRILRTHRLGEALSLRKPTVAVDSGLTMHVLYLSTPSFWGHAKISAEGKLLGVDLYRPGPGGAPRLARLQDGGVSAVGGLLYDPKKEAEAREKNRKASDRPGFIYE